jgi:hypothetical protein
MYFSCTPAMQVNIATLPSPPYGSEIESIETA